MKATNYHMFINKLITYIKNNKNFDTAIRSQKSQLTTEEYQMIIESYCLYRKLIRHAIDKDLPIIINENFISINIYYQGIIIIFKEYQDHLVIEQNKVSNQEINYSSVMKRTKKTIS